MPRTKQGKFVTEASEFFQKADDFWRAGDSDKACEFYRRAADLYHQNDDEEGEAFALGRLGELELSLENYDEAEKVLKTAAKLLKSVDYAQNTYGEILIRQAQVEIARENYSSALKYLQSADKVLSAIGSHGLLGDVYDQEAYVHLLEGRDATALAAYRKAAEEFHSGRVEQKEASTLRAIARIEMKERNYDEAHDVLERCRKIYREIGDLLGEASVLSAIGCLRFVIRDIVNARKALRKSVYLYSKASHHYAQAEALLYLARVEAFDKQLGDFDLAKAHYKRSAELFDFMGNEIMKKSVVDEYYNFLNRISC